MRKIILIAAIALTSAAAQAGETGNLSTAEAPSGALATNSTKQIQAQIDAPVATPAKPADTPRYSLPPSETQTPADPARNVSDAPHYTARPAPVDNVPLTTTSTASPTMTPMTAQPGRQYDDRGYYDDAGYHPFPRRYDRYAERPHGYTGRPYRRARWNARRVIAELHRYGIYW